MKRLFVALLASSFMLQASSYALASGTETKEECTTETGAYGQTSKVCKIVSETTEPVHEPVKAGVGDINFWVMAIMLTAGAAGLYKLARATENLYWFD